MNTAPSPCQHLVLGEQHQHTPAESQKEAVGFSAKVECGVKGQGVHGKNHARPFSGSHFVPIETKSSAVSPMHHSSVTGQMSLSTWHHATRSPGIPALGSQSEGDQGAKCLWRTPWICLEGFSEEVAFERLSEQEDPHHSNVLSRRGRAPKITMNQHRPPSSCGQRDRVPSGRNDQKRKTFNVEKFLCFLSTFAGLPVYFYPNCPFLGPTIWKPSWANWASPGSSVTGLSSRGSVRKHP